MTEKDYNIHCNYIPCRRSLAVETQACVTSCSHIFCINCANSSFTKALVCPACKTSVAQRDDIFVTQLNPSEEYKSSVLSGLHPDIIMDICSRSISFYYYQCSQEICYRSMVQKSLEQKSNDMEERFRKVTYEMNHAIKVEQQKNMDILREQELERRRSYELQHQLQEKSKQFQKLQAMYEKLKRKTMVPSIQQNFQQQQEHQSNIISREVTPSLVGTPPPLAPPPFRPPTFTNNRIETFQPDNYQPNLRPYSATAANNVSPYAPPPLAALDPMNTPVRSNRAHPLGHYSSHQQPFQQQEAFRNSHHHAPASENLHPNPHVARMPPPNSISTRAQSTVGQPTHEHQHKHGPGHHHHHHHHHQYPYQHSVHSISLPPPSPMRSARRAEQSGEVSPLSDRHARSHLPPSTTSSNKTAALHHGRQPH